MRFASALCTSLGIGFMSDTNSIHRFEFRRAAAPVSLAIALLWVAPMTVISVIAAHRQDTVLGRAWSNGWYVLYLLSLLAWKLPAAWFSVVGWEASGEIYELLGVRWFKQFMIDGDRHNRRVRKQLGSHGTLGSRRSIEELVKQTVASEKIHAIMFLFALWPTLLALIWRWWAWAVGLIICNTVINVYPIMLQRYTRSRIAKVHASKRKNV
jgi:hypothetical protein